MEFVSGENKDSTGSPAVKGGVDDAENYRSSVGISAPINEIAGIHVEEPPIPQRFIDGVNGDMVEAKKRWENTLQWRKKDKVDEVLQEPQPHYNLIKKYYPHYIAGRGKEGHSVFYCRPGDFNSSKFIAHGITTADLVRHWLFGCEYQWNILERGDPVARAIIVFDGKGTGLSDLTGYKQDFVKATLSLANAHYPERSHVVIVVNAPLMARIMWSIVRPWVDPNTAKKVRILGGGAESLKGLQEFIDDDNIPTYDGGKLTYGDGSLDCCRFHSPDVLAEAEYVRALNERHGIDASAEVVEKKK